MKEWLNKNVRFKTFWMGVFVILMGLGILARSEEGSYEYGLELIIAGLMAIFVRDGIRKGPSK